MSGIKRNYFVLTDRHPKKFSGRNQELKPYPMEKQPGDTLNIPVVVINISISSKSVKFLVELTNSKTSVVS